MGFPERAQEILAVANNCYPRIVWRPHYLCAGLCFGNLHLYTILKRRASSDSFERSEDIHLAQPIPVVKRSADDLDGASRTQIRRLLRVTACSRPVPYFS